MEDRHVLVQLDNGLLGAIFDGHRGSSVADLAADTFADLYHHARSSFPEEQSRLVAALAAIPTRDITGGACAVAFHLRGSELAVANVGDCELAWAGDDGTNLLLTVKHGLANEQERHRVQRAGAIVAPPYFFNPATGQGLMPTRSLGDHDLEGVGLIHMAASVSMILSPPGWIVGACDGLWDVMRAGELPGLLFGAAGADDAVQRLSHEALDVRRTGDNLTIIVVRVGL